MLACLLVAGMVFVVSAQDEAAPAEPEPAQDVEASTEAVEEPASEPEPAPAVEEEIVHEEAEEVESAAIEAVPAEEEPEQTTAPGSGANHAFYSLPAVLGGVVLALKFAH